MKIAILTSGILPVPAVQGGAVENLIDYYLEYNDQHHLHDITIYSVYHPAVEKHPTLKSEYNHYIYFHVDTFMAKIMKRIHHLFHKEEYYHYTIEYFFDLAFKKIKKQKYDIIILENRPYFALRLKGETEAQIICHQHTDTLSIESSKHDEVYSAISRFITVSDFIGNRIKTINPQDTKCITVHNGIDTKAFSPSKCSGTARKDLGFLSSDFIVLYSGRIMPKKGIAELIDAINLLQDEQNIKLLIIGSSFYANASDDDNFTKLLKDKAKPISNRIFFTGYIPYERIPEYLKIVDVAAIPSLLNDAFPTTVLEAQAMGLPIITTNFGGIPEQVSSDNAIIIYSRSDFVQHLANAIRTIYKDTHKRENMKKASQERAQLFQKEIYAHNFFKVLSL